MAKFLLLILLAIVVSLIWRNAKQRAADSAKRAARATAPERIVACAFCGVHVPESEAVSDDGRMFCGESHRQAYRSGAH